MLRILVLAGTICGLLCGCGSGAPNCTTQLVTSVAPASATADHLAKAPGDQQQFQAAGRYQSSSPGSSPGCAVPALVVLEQPNWTVSDPVNVSISSAKDGTNGLATYLGATQGAVTVTAGAVGTAPPATASLTCR